MELKIFLAMIVFAFAMAGSPGPNNVLLTFSGANFGYKRSLPQLIGIVLGIASMILLMGAGLSWVFQSYPLMQWGLKICGSFYLAYLAYRILKQSQTHSSKRQQQRPMLFRESFIFQYLNPKAWLMTSSAVASFSIPGEQYWISIASLVLAFAIVNPITGSIWLSFGHFIASFLSQPKTMRYFNVGMSSLTLACVALLWM
ncbi:LysE family translocator [Alginatibacterium sediminis]|uniref:LysE family translocator n=1 Tax=Alginatibacterium sediminis TaxID=2164068 RepID=A0A420E6Q5_9ALTE|nr:LysE family translocator [Alginatibacterium sediminis]RKF13647.1 LysE family translocator [Alginatibacterium sediminis]